MLSKVNRNAKKYTSNRTQAIPIALLSIGLIIVYWYFHKVKLNNLQTTIPHPFSVDFFETKFLYFYLHLFTFIPVFLLSFDKKVAYYKKWKALIPSILIVGAFFIFWDVIFTMKGVWGFNESYITGWSLFHLPIEEWLFFVTVPFACAFIYECLIAYFKGDALKNISNLITNGLIIIFLIAALFSFSKVYTFSNFFLGLLLLVLHKFYIKKAYISRFYSAFVVCLIPFVLLNGLLTGSFTKAPVVVYNPLEFIGDRFITIPFDDFFYCFVYLLSIITLFEFFKGRREKI